MLAPGSEILVCCNVAGPAEFPARLLLAAVGRSEWVVFTPDAGIYNEDYSSDNQDVACWRLRLLGRTFPCGVVWDQIYDIDSVLSGMQLEQLLAEGAVQRRSGRSADSPRRGSPFAPEEERLEVDLNGASPEEMAPLEASPPCRTLVLAPPRVRTRVAETPRRAW